MLKSLHGLLVGAEGRDGVEVLVAVLNDVPEWEVDELRRKRVGHDVVGQTLSQQLSNQQLDENDFDCGNEVEL